VVADVRRYFMPVKPLTLSVRVAHSGRYGFDAEDPHLLALYAGYQDIVHGYQLGSFDLQDCGAQNASGACAMFDNLKGSRLAVINLEARAPLLGLFRGELDYGRLPIEIGGFYDAGVVWTRGSLPTIAGGVRVPVRSIGAVARVNVFGIAIVEFAVSHPFDRAGRPLQFQIGFMQGF